MNFKLSGALDVRDGYGYITQSLALALDQLGHKVWVNPVKIWNSNEQLKERTKNLTVPIKDVDFELIIMYPVYDFGQVHKNAAIITMYEAHICPAEWAFRLNRMKLPIFAPSKFVKDMFVNSGVKTPVEHLHLGVDTLFYNKELRKFPDKGEPFRFLTVGKLEPRKNIEGAVRAFNRAFPHNENVEFIIKTRERFLTTEIKEAAKKDSRIKIIEKTITEDELLKLYQYCHCFVYSSRGEGFAFPPRCAIATGMPALVTGWSALNEITGAIKIPIQGISPMPPCGFSYGNHEKMFMANIDEDYLSSLMRLYAANPDKYNALAKETYKVKQETWLDCAYDFVGLANKYTRKGVK